MSTSYSPTPAILPASITLPQDLVDQRTAASVNVPFKSLADAIAYLNESITHWSVVSGHECVGLTGLITASEPSQTSPVNGLDPSTALQLSTGGFSFTLASGSTDTYHAVIPINAALIDGATLTRVRVYLTGAGSHVGLPAVMPAFTVLGYDYTANTMVSMYSGGYNVDASASTAAYQVTHDIVAAPNQNNVIDKAKYNYFVAVRNECSTNALAYLAVHAARIEQTARRFAG